MMWGFAQARKLHSACAGERIPAPARIPSDPRFVPVFRCSGCVLVISGVGREIASRIRTVVDALSHCVPAGGLYRPQSKSPGPQSQEKKMRIQLRFYRDFPVLDRGCSDQHGGEKECERATSNEEWRWKAYEHKWEWELSGEGRALRWYLYDGCHRNSAISERVTRSPSLALSPEEPPRFL
jgi:hypothetical protein